MPRYHFSANNDCFYQRAPFINYDIKLQPKHVCRFVAIGRFPTLTEPSKGKYLYAIQTSPLESLEKDKLEERPDDLTENPYIKLIVLRDKKLESQTNEADRAHGDLDSIFNSQTQESLEERIEKISSMTENTTLHVSGFKE